MTLKVRSDQPSTFTLYPRNRSGVSAVPRLRRCGHSRELAFYATCAISLEDPWEEHLPAALMTASSAVEMPSLVDEMLLAVDDDDDEDDEDEDDDYEDDGEDEDEEDDE